MTKPISPVERGWLVDTRSTALGAALVAGAVLVVAVGMDHITFDALSGFLTLLVLTLIAVPVLNWVARREGDPRYARMLIWALVAKIVGTFVRYYVIAVVYHNNADAGVYSDGGEILAANLRAGIFSFNIPELAGRGTETERIAQVVGVVYAFTGDSRYAGFFVFSFLCFIGQILMWRAFKRAVPEGDHYRYGLLVLFLPSLLFWPSSIGKEALMLFSVGVVCYGAAQIFGERVKTGGIVTFLLGAFGLFLIRPHMALIAIVALGVASAVGTVAGFRDRSSMRAFAVRLLALLVLVGAAGAATSGLSRFFSEGKNKDETGITSVLARTQEQTKQGGSEFAAPSVDSPVKLPAGVVTVLFRPFPWEAHSLNSQIAAAEGILLLAMFASGYRRVITWFRVAPRRPYLVFASVYAFVFVITFSYIGNFGILARQRTQMLPLILTMIAMAPAPRTRTSLLGFRPTAGRPASEDVDDAAETADADVPTAGVRR